MGSTFSSYEIARSGMYTSQRGLDVTGHNVSNVNTSGYVRQQMISEDKPYMLYGKNQIGTGAGIDEVRQMRSIFLDAIYRKENSKLGYWSTMSSTVEDVESIMDSLSDDSISQIIGEFFDGWEELSKDPESRSCREALIEYGNSMADIFNQLDEQLDQIQNSLDSQIYSLVDEINSISAQVAELNKKILTSEAGRNNANDYRDQLNLLLDTLSGYVNINAAEDDSGMIKVTIGGTVLVNGDKASKLTCKTNVSNGAFATVLWENTGTEVKVKSGKLMGLIAARGDVNGNKGSIENGSPAESEDVDSDSDIYSFTAGSENFISELRKGLNIMVNLLVRKANEIQSGGIGLDGSTGTDFFTKIDESLPFEIGNIKVNPALEDTDKIAASLTGSTGDGSNASKIVDFKETGYFQNDALKMNIDDFCSFIVNWVGTMGQEAENFTSNQSTLVLQVQNKKDSLSAVSLDEEVNNMIKFQHAYNASAQVMNVIDSMIDKIINETGTVGR